MSERRPPTPWADTPEDAAFDAQFAGIGPVEPPRAVVHATLDAVREARAASAAAEVGPPPPPAPSESLNTVGEAPVVVPLRRRRPWLAAAAGALALAAGWLLLPAAPLVGDTATMVPKGDGHPALALDLRAVVHHADGGTERMRSDRRYAAGDTLHFRVSASEPMPARLYRDETLVWAGEIGPDALDVPAGWAVEAGDAPGRFVLLAGGTEAAIDYAGGAP